MATITVRDLDDDVQLRIKKRAAANNRSMEAEARAILTAAVRNQAMAAWIAATEDLRGDDFVLPPRSMPREIDLT